MVFQRFGKKVLLLITAVLLTACSDGGSHHNPVGPDGSGGSNTSTTQTGSFIDSPVEGLTYTSPLGTDLTDAQGRFEYRPGDTVRFTLASIPLGQVAGREILSPLDIFNAEITDQQVINLSRVLQALDSDGNPTNGITLDNEQLAESTLTRIDFDVDPGVFGTTEDGANPDLHAFIADYGFDGALPTPSQAIKHLSCSLEQRGRQDEAGGWCDTQTFFIKPGPNATTEALLAFIQAQPGDVVEFDCGFFEMDTALVLQSVDNITVRGCGIDQTVLSFANSDSPEGLLAINVRGLEVSDLTIADTPGDGIKLKSVQFGTLRNVRAFWGSEGTPITVDNYQDAIQVSCTLPPRQEGAPALDYQVSSSSGRYGIYPVESENILVENSESIGASDAGIYVGQTNNAIIRNSRAAYNVMGFEIENVQGGEYINNTAECNTGGFLIYDLDNLTQYGERSRMHGNIARNNNQYNFASGGFVSVVPRGSGFITLGYDRIEVFNNTFKDHDTASMIIVSYNLVNLGREPNDLKLDGYTEGLHIHHNTFINGGNNPAEADYETILLSTAKSVLPEPVTSENNQPEKIETLLPTLVRLKNNGRGAHIVWDGILDEWNENCPYPTDFDGEPIPDNNGKPVWENHHKEPGCRYNKYKFSFDSQGNPIDEDDNGFVDRTMPDWFTCIDSNNSFDAISQQYANFHGLDGTEALLPIIDGNPEMLTDENYLLSAANALPGFTADTDISVHDCINRFGKTLEPLKPVVLRPYSPSGENDVAYSDEQIAKLCNTPPQPGDINRAALDVNCPLLQHYNLFENPEEPRSTPNGGGVPFVLNTKLFSDYAVKYRVAYVPPGQAATYKDFNDGINATIEFPVGTVLAKTFAFRDGEQEEVIETRLLIKRENSSGKPRWAGLPYIWETAEDGKRIAKLAIKGGNASVSWNYRDADSDKLLQGSTDSYAIPHANQCMTCHGNNDKVAGAPPIGPKPRNLNRPYKPESDFMGDTGQGGFTMINQLQYWANQGLLTGLPENAKLDASQRLEGPVTFLPKFNVPGDSGETAHSPADKEARLRAYLEVNCQHCHNDKGTASNTGLYLDHLRPVNAKYGICKTPTAAGTEGSGGHSYVIVPGNASDSIMPFRVKSEKDKVEAMMPPMGRSTVHQEAASLLDEWINEVVDSSYENAGDQGCENTGSGPNLLPEG